MDLVSPRPFWLLKNGLVHEYPSLDHNVHSDVAVLGAGISGALIAQRLARAGFEVLVIDKRDVACGSTCASTALLQYEIDTHLVDLTRRIGKRDAERAYRACHESIAFKERLSWFRRHRNDSNVNVTPAPPAAVPNRTLRERQVHVLNRFVDLRRALVPNRHSIDSRMSDNGVLRQPSVAISAAQRRACFGFRATPHRARRVDRDLSR